MREFVPSKKGAYLLNDLYLQNFKRITQYIKNSYNESLDFKQEVTSNKELIQRAVQSLLKTEPLNVKKRIESEFFEYGPLQELLNNPEVTEIIINAADKIFYEAEGRFYSYNDIFLSSESYENFVARLCDEANIQYDLKTPYANGHWNNFRVHLIIPPISQKIQITLRRIRFFSWKFSDLIHTGFMPETLAQNLENLIQEQENFLIVGPTGCGKTSCLNAFLDVLPENHRCILIEDTKELKLPNTLSTRLLTREDIHEDLPPINASDLVKQSLRMRPESLIMGEVRGSEAKDYLLTLSTGHSGMSSIHAKSAQQALLRLEMLVKMGAPQWSLSTIRNLITLSLNIIVTLGFKKAQRTLLSVDRLISYDGGNVYS